MTEELKAAYAALKASAKRQRALEKQVSQWRRFGIRRAVQLGDAGQAVRRLELLELRNEQQRELLDELEANHRLDMVRQQRLQEELEETRRLNQQDVGAQKTAMFKEANDRLQQYGDRLDEQEIELDFADPNLFSSTRDGDA